MINKIYSYINYQLNQLQGLKFICIYIHLLVFNIWPFHSDIKFIYFVSLVCYFLQNHRIVPIKIGSPPNLVFKFLATCMHILIPWLLSVWFYILLKQFRYAILYNENLQLYSCMLIRKHQYYNVNFTLNFDIINVDLKVHHLWQCL